MSDLPIELLPTAHAVLRMLDPRLSETERAEATETAKAQPDFALGMLTSIIEDVHRRAEAVWGQERGAQLDRLRTRLLGDLTDDEVLGVALNDAAPGEPVRLLLALSPDMPRPPAQANGETPGGVSGGSVWGGPLDGSQGLSEAVEDDLMPEPLVPVIPVAPEPVADDFTACSSFTSQGPCVLRKGHPAGPGFPGENGHIGGPDA